MLKSYQIQYRRAKGLLTLTSLKCYQIHNAWAKKFSDGLNTILSNIELTLTLFFEHRTWTCSYIGHRTWTPYFWLWTNEHPTSNPKGISLDLLNYSSNWLKHHSFKHLTNSNLFRVHLLVIELEHPFFDFERSNIELRT